MASLGGVGKGEKTVTIKIPYKAALFYLHVKSEISTAGENDTESGFAIRTASFKDTPSCPLSHVAILPCPVTEAALFGQRIDANAGTSCSHAGCSCRGITFQYWF